VSGISLTEETTRAIDRADLVIGVLDPQQTSPNVYWELGYARGVGIPVILLVPPEMKALPTEAAGILQIRTTPDNREAIAFSLENALRGIELTRPAAGKRRQHQPQVPHHAAGAQTRRPDEAVRTSYRTKLIGTLADSLLVKLQTALADESVGLASALESERIVVSALRATGVTLLTHRSGARGPDIAIWHDELQRVVGNPLLIEVKTALSTADEAAHAAEQLKQYLLDSNAITALLLYGRAPLNAQDRLPGAPRVLHASIAEFIGGLRTQSLATFLRMLRNQAIHY
jgi:hypothetical protein